MSLPNKGILFVCGVPRSGTTLLQRLLLSAFNLRTGQESSVIDGMLAPFKVRIFDDAAEERKGLGLLGYLSSYEVDLLLAKVCDTVFMTLFDSLDGHYGDANYEYFLEKTPSNLLYLRDIFAYVPRSKVIIVERKTIDILKSLVRARKGWGKDWVPKNFWRLYKFISIHLDAIEQSRSEVNHDLIFVKYEDLRSNPGSVLDRLRDFLEIEYLSSFKLDDYHNLLDKRTKIPIKNGAGWDLLVEDDDFIKNRAAFSFRDRLDLVLVGLLLWLRERLK